MSDEVCTTCGGVVHTVTVHHANRRKTVWRVCENGHRQRPDGPVGPVGTPHLTVVRGGR